MNVSEKKHILKTLTPDEIKIAQRASRSNMKEEKKNRMLNGEIPPIDKNYFEMYHGKEVVVETRTGKFINGTIRMPKKDSGIDGYIVSKVDGSILSTLEFYERPHNTPKQIGYKSGAVMLFTIERPNHKYIFESFEDRELSRINELKEMSKRLGTTPFKLIEEIDRLSEKYPDQFI